MGGGADEPLGPFFFSESSIFSPTALFLPKFPLKGIITVFPIEMHRRPMLTLPSTRSRSSQGHALYTHCSVVAIDASRQVSLKSVHRFQIIFLKGFYHICAWWPSWSRDLDYVHVYRPWFLHLIDDLHKVWL